jgi:glutathione synthase/RimK-type ligase-like ATP-grasp enzyme
MSARIAFAISNEFPNLTDDDRLAATALNERGIQVDPVLWDSSADWAAYDAVVIRSCWDYHHRLEEFSRWLAQLDGIGATVWNPVDVLRWNMDKTYLSDLEERGVPVLPSVWLPRGSKAELGHLMAEKQWQKVVVKPTVSAAADNTFTLARSDAPERQAALDKLLAAGGVIVQEFASEIQSEGEYSFLFFNDQFSHAVIKRPQDGDFRVQLQYGGGFRAAEAPADLVRQAAKIQEALEVDLLYARVDAIDRGGQLFLMELELVEPHLFFAEHPQAPTRFADALLSRLSEPSLSFRADTK